jgi:hypothetical protein
MHVHQIQMKGARGAFRSTTKRCIAIQDEKQIARRSRPKQGREGGTNLQDNVA